MNPLKPQSENWNESFQRERAHIEREDDWTPGEKQILTDLGKAKFQFAVKLTFPPEAFVVAHRWARKHEYDYDDDHHLLFDAMTSGEIEPEGFKEVEALED